MHEGVIIKLIDEEGHPVEVPGLIPETEEEKKKYEAAKLRRIQRLKRSGKV